LGRLLEKHRRVPGTGHVKPVCGDLFRDASEVGALAGSLWVLSDPARYHGRKHK
jgi:hypothetical protein